MITFEPILGSPEMYALTCVGFSLLVLASLIRLEARRLTRLGKFASPVALARLVRGRVSGFRGPLNMFVVAGVISLMVALAGPHWGFEDTGRGRAAREILVLLDTSESMNAIDPAPSRLDRARRKITELLLRHPADRFGLIAFSGGAALQCPLTNDQAYFQTILYAVDTDALSEEGTDIEAALLAAEILFEGADEKEDSAGRSGRIVLLISDGEEVTGNAIAAAARLRRSSHMMVLGIGNPEGAEISMPTWMHRGTPRGKAVHVSRLDEENLANIAVEGGGVYVRSTVGDEDLNVIDRELAYLQSGLGGDVVGHHRVNRFRWPLATAILCFLMEGVWLVILPYLSRDRGESTAGGGPS